MSALIVRQPAGTTAGGQFAPTHHSEGEVELGVPDSLESVEPAAASVKGLGVQSGIASWNKPGLRSYLRRQFVIALMTDC